MTWVTMFVGRIERKVDPSGRFCVPAKWFKAAGENKFVYVMPDPEKVCLRMIPSSAMDARLAKLRERAQNDPETNQALLTIGAVVEQPKVDDEGRIEISRKLRDFAGIKRRLVMVGGEWYTRLWSPKVFRGEKNNPPPGSLAEVVKAVAQQQAAGFSPSTVAEV